MHKLRFPCIFVVFVLWSLDTVVHVLRPYQINLVFHQLLQSERGLGRMKKEKSRSYLQFMNLIKSLAKSGSANGQLKEKNLRVSRTDDSNNIMEREVQDVGEKDILYELLLDDIGAQRR